MRWPAIAVLALCAAYGLHRHVFSRSVYEPPSAAAPAAPALVVTAVPVQENLPPMSAVLRKDGYRITPLATFHLTGRVLSRKTYCCSSQDRLAPVDIAFGWGRMSHDTVLASLQISQGSRWYHFRYRHEPPIPQREIEVSSANMHLIPSRADIEDTLRGVRPGQTVTLAGFLVRAEKDDWHWQSSLSREDTGDGACEVIWVTDVRVHGAQG